MENPSVVLCSFGGDSFHMPGHSVPACVTAYVEGADLIRLIIQPSKDGIPILYPYADLSETTDGKGKVSEFNWEELRKLDAGHTFKRGKDYPWRRWAIKEDGRERVKRHHRLTRFESLCDVLEGEVTYALQFSKSNPDNPVWEKLVTTCLNHLDRVGADQIILCTDNASHVDAFRQVSEGKFPLGLIVDTEEDVKKVEESFDYVFCPWELFKKMGEEPRKKLLKYRLIVHVPVVNKEPVSKLKEVYGIETTSMMRLSPLVRGSRVRFLEEFKGKEVNRNHWVVGISSGYTNLHRAAFNALDDRGQCEVKVYQDDALIVDVAEGYQYASGAAVTRFSVSGDFSAETAFSYENPQRATEMVLCAINTTVFPIYHREGAIKHVSVGDEHPAFDAHGLCPYVSVEREEADGSRIMYNESFSELFNLRATNIYRHDVGAGNSKNVELRMARRGRFFVGHYKDELNPEWIGLGYVENNSMNNRVFFRIAGKHYPKRGAPDPLPWNRFVFKRFCIQCPRS